MCLVGCCSGTTRRSNRAAVLAGSTCELDISLSGLWFAHLPFAVAAPQSLPPPLVGGKSGESSVHMEWLRAVRRNLRTARALVRCGAATPPSLMLDFAPSL